MPSIHVFEPALCCNTGVCGPDPSERLVAFTADLDHLKGQGADIARHNLANDPTAFAQVAPVREFLRVAGSEGLPVVVVDETVVLTGRYPSRAELERYAGLQTGAVLTLTPVAPKAESSCCSAPATSDAAATAAASGCCGSSASSCC